MSNENLAPVDIPTVADMLRMTGANTAEFMKQVAEHIDKLESEIVQLRQRVEELEIQKDIAK
jgi:uncharacterized protein YceH (UPF0502 family)